MFRSNQISDTAKRYLCRFYEILDEMTAGMTGAELTDSLSHNFIVQMIPHHRAAIEMSRNLLQYTTFVPLQNIAKNIIVEQTESIGNMQAVLDRCGGLSSTEQDLCLYQRRFQRIAQAMFSQMRSACAGTRINADFMREMIPHHEGAVRMSENALCFPLCPELVPILSRIIVSQKKGVREMKRLLRCV